MDQTINLIFTIVGAALTLLAVYGAVKLNRKLFLSGICYFSILPLIGEGMAYNADKAPIHIIVIFVFLAQIVLAFPSNIVYGQENAAAVKLTSKIALALLIINIGGAVYILCLKADVPAQFGYFHAVFALTILYLIFRRISSGGAALLK
jgi:hypothetical protein